MSEKVERRILALLDKPLVCPHGNPIPGLDQLGLPFETMSEDTPLVSLHNAVDEHERELVVYRISEQLQSDAEIMHRLDKAGLRPGLRMRASLAADGVTVCVDNAGTPVPFGTEITDHIFVTAA